MAVVFIFVLGFISVFMTPATSQLDILSVRTIEDGSSFTITCNAQRVVNTQGNFSTIDRLQIDIWNNGANKYTMVAQYLAFGPPAILNGSQFPPAGKNWKFSFTGSNSENRGINNLATMKIEILVPTGKCEDAGLYRCTMSYYISNAVITDFSEQNVTSTATTTEPLVVLDPVYEAPVGVSNTSTYDEGANITVTCRFQGPEQLSIKWKRERRPAFGVDVQFDDYAIANDITTDTPTRVPQTSATCPQYSHESVLRLTISSEDDDRQYQCVVVSGGTEQARSAVLIQVDKASGNTPPPSGVSGANTKPDNIGLIVGVVIGCVVAVIIIIVVIVICCLRSKRNKKSAHDTDRPDGGHDQPVPPPVLYSRPNKGINNNNNSRDSKALDEDGRREPRSRQHDDASYKTKEGKPYRYNPSISNDAYIHELKQRNGLSQQNDDNLYYASTDVSRSEDESVEQLVVPPGRSKSNSKPRNLPPVPRPREDNKQLNYIQLDLPPSKQEGSENAGHRNRSTMVEYAEISV